MNAPPYLEVPHRRGRPLAAYLYLPRRAGEKSYKSQRVEAGLVIDFGREGKPLGIEIMAPTKVTLAAINRVLRDLRLPVLKKSDLDPLRTA